MTSTNDTKLYLILNAGSSSIKFQLFARTNEEYKVICRGIAERITVDGALSIVFGDKKVKKKTTLPNHDVAIKTILEELKNQKVIQDLKEIVAIGHRIVHGGKVFIKPTLVTDEVMQKFTKMLHLAPLHNPAHLAVIKALRAQVDLPNVLVFDTSFHNTIPEVNALYPVPYEWYTENNVQRYGFHGISYEYIVKRLNEIKSPSVPDINAVICHLGNGSSVAAIAHNKSIDTSMGLTPLAGLMMGTRCGDLDPSVHEYIAQERNLSLTEITKALNHKSGLLSVSGVSSDLREIESVAAKGNQRCELALEIYAQRVANYIVRYANLLKGNMKYLVFTAGIGENSEVVVGKIMKHLHILPIISRKELFAQKNGEKKDYFFLSEKNSPLEVLVMATNEELMICQMTDKMVRK